jgi:hypothetical protein
LDDVQILVGMMLIRISSDKEEKKWWPQQERPRPCHIHALLQLFALRWQRQGHQTLYCEEYGGECCCPRYQRE